MNYKLLHIGINCEDKKAAADATALFSMLFDLSIRETATSYFADPCIECMKGQGRGKNGHIALAADDLEEAIRQLSEKGVKTDPLTYSYDESGRLKNAYLANEIAGFAIHIMQAK